MERLYRKTPLNEIPWNIETPPDVLVFGNSASVYGRKYTIFSDVMIMGRILPINPNNYSITALVANVLDVQHLTVKTISLAGADNLTTFSNGLQGQLVTLLFMNNNCTIVNGAAMNLAGSVNFNPAAGDVVQFMCRDNTNWYEVSRSVN